ncbi:hypothetical protein BJ928_1541 [Rhizobium sp. WW_1]|mgnify:CR=1 FL=1|jgi:hypothetical protein|nr:hypothetical protein BJ928_1541 [Rhizobium sp. WW_1]
MLKKQRTKWDKDGAYNETTGRVFDRRMPSLAVPELMHLDHDLAVRTARLDIGRASESWL